MVILLDCNIWITLSINKQLDLVLRLIEKEHTLVSCQQLESELLDVINRPKLKRFLPSKTIDYIHLIFKRSTANYEIGTVPIVVTDPKDNYLFALCKKSNAHYFVTGDKLLLGEKQYGNTKIITLAELKNLL